MNIEVSLRNIVAVPFRRCEEAFDQCFSGRDNPLLVTLAVSGCTVMVMCPSMSLIATALFTGIDSEFFARFLATLYRNLPWALLWQIFSAGPATRGVFRAIFHKQLVENDRKAFSSDTECDKMDT